MTAVIIIASIAAIAPTVAAIATLVTALRVRQKLAVVETAAATQGTKLELVHELVNSRLTAALDKIDRLEKKLQALTGKPPTGEPPPDPTMNKPTDLIPRRDP